MEKAPNFYSVAMKQVKDAQQTDRKKTCCYIRLNGHYKRYAGRS
jgi:hypothetical protein